MSEVITYECSKCGTEVIVNKNEGADLRPIYCCGLEVNKVKPIRAKSSRATVKNVSKGAGKLSKRMSMKSGPKKTGSSTNRKSSGA